MAAHIRTTASVHWCPLQAVSSKKSLAQTQAAAGQDGGGGRAIVYLVL